MWLALILKERLGKSVDWPKIDKRDCLSAMEKSPIDPLPIHKLLKSGLTDNAYSHETFMKGMDYSYYYEDID